QYMQNARLKNHPVNVWTVNDPERARVLNALGVHSIMTDMPAVIIEALSRP
ncbi:MAG: glycerophosphodiester phosphodiesterase, partial [Phototrophicales bacterium]